jgi:hypothetical protein
MYSLGETSNSTNNSQDPSSSRLALIRKRKMMMPAMEAIRSPFCSGASSD